MSARPQTIVNRLTRCGCGCRGRDPWHRAEFKRIVFNDMPAEPGATCVTKTQPGMGEQPIAREGRAKIPGYPRPIRVVRVIVLEHVMPFWEIDNEDAVNARSGR